MEAPQLSKLWLEPKLPQTAKLDCFANQFKSLKISKSPRILGLWGQSISNSHDNNITQFNCSHVKSIVSYRFITSQTRHRETAASQATSGPVKATWGRRTAAVIMGVGNAEVTEVSGRKARREREEKGSSWKSLVATLSVREGLQAGMDSWGGDVTPKG
ncbi:hypothetical protein DKX38_009046 [Salix brachista]|uniref:Uncharacterized protein n=1 Tax=Salix brachista TaxID=2182728 RepID=A0A5N5M9I0_9ROSI|nr:hypothetical protein DKX38_009046 [Salix brachista]